MCSEVPILCDNSFGLISASLNMIEFGGEVPFKEVVANFSETIKEFYTEYKVKHQSNTAK
jgi:hypothetical protein